MSVLDVKSSIFIDNLHWKLMTYNSYWSVAGLVVKTSQNTPVLPGDVIGLLKWRTVQKELMAFGFVTSRS